MAMAEQTEIELELTIAWKLIVPGEKKLGCSELWGSILILVI